MNKTLEKYQENLEIMKKYIKMNFKNLNSEKLIHIAGTNGKGTTAHLISSILISNNYNVGLFTSPHMDIYNERIKINNIIINDNELNNIKKKHDEFIKKNNLSYYESSFIYACSYFNNKNPDYIIFEVGLGGKYDATNVLNYLYSVITKISYDHSDILGNSLEEIAKEKLGIVKTKRENIFYYQDQEEKVNLVFEKYKISNISYNNGLLIKNINNIGFKYNLDLSLNVTKKILGESDFFNISNIERIINNFKIKTNFIGREQLMNTNPNIYYDIAHNYDSIKLLLKNIKNIEKYDLYFSFNKSKKLKEVFKEINLLDNKKIYINNSTNNNYILKDCEYKYFDEVYDSIDEIEFTNNSYVMGSTYIYSELKGYVLKNY